MRSVAGVIALVLLAIGIAVIASHVHPGGALPPDEIQAEQDAAAQKAAQDKRDKQKALIDHSPDAFDKVKAGAIQATLQFVDKPPIQIELYPAAAPKTVQRVSTLIKQGFYKGIKVHRVESGASKLRLFQFGDPESKGVLPQDFQSKMVGTHGTGTTVPLELKLPHVQYAIGMARNQMDDSGDSQMYINTGPNPDLDGAYCIFGRVVGGQAVLDTIKVGDEIKSFTIP